MKHTTNTNTGGYRDAELQEFVSRVYGVAVATRMAADRPADEGPNSSRNYVRLTGDVEIVRPAPVRQGRDLIQIIEVYKGGELAVVIDLGLSMTAEIRDLIAEAILSPVQLDSRYLKLIG